MLDRIFNTTLMLALMALLVLGTHALLFKATPATARQVAAQPTFKLPTVEIVGVRTPAIGKADPVRDMVVARVR
jgi:hypothetical protein